MKTLITLSILLASLPAFGQAKATAGVKTMGFVNDKSPDVAVSTALLRATLNCEKDLTFELVSVSLTYVSTDDSNVPKGNFVAVVIVECEKQPWKR
jgi:hypothetical protein